MNILAPGNILQNIYLKEKIKRNNWKSFIEIGSGNGIVSNILLNQGLRGIGCDLNKGACENNILLNNNFIENGEYIVLNTDFTKIEIKEKYDLIISCMVIEHLEEQELNNLIFIAKTMLKQGGSILFFVPSSMKYWGIEDEIAGHIKRYEFKDFEILGKKNQLTIKELHGLTYPLSNWLYSLSNWIVKKSEREKLKLTLKERTIYTGNRNVLFKTKFPLFFKVILNECVMMPFHLLQKKNYNNPNSLVICCEFKIKSTL
jgi:SAM-dependent methyltransferase